MADASLPFFKELVNLRSDASHDWDDRTRGRAPQKPFLLLSVMDGIESGWISDHQIKLTRDLVDTFFTYWNAIMGKDRVTTIALPYYHMQSEQFWELVYEMDESPFSSSPSLGSLRNRVQYAELARELFEEFSNPEQRDQYRQLLLSTFFNEETAEQLRELVSLNRLAYEYSEDMLGRVAEPFRKYASDDEKRYAEQVGKRQIRNKGFRRAIRLVYEDMCALCRSRVVTRNDESLIESAHIIPWENNGTDDPRNGLALCGTHHWLFDRHLYTIDKEYRIVLSGWLKRKENKIEAVLKQETEQIFLPDDKNFYPSQEALEEHRVKFDEVNE